MEQFGAGSVGKSSPNASVSSSSWFWPAKFVCAKLCLLFLEGALVSRLRAQEEARRLL